MVTIIAAAMSFGPVTEAQVFSINGKKGFVHFDREHSTVYPCRELTNWQSPGSKIPAEICVANYFPESVKVMMKNELGVLEEPGVVKPQTSNIIDACIKRSCALHDVNGN